MNYIKSKHLPRRLILRGIGASMALPFLEAMGAKPSSKFGLNKLATGYEGQPIRYGAIFMPNGAAPGTFVPSGSNLDVLPDALAPLGEMAKHVNVISGLSTSMGGHVASTASFLTGQKPASAKGSNELNILNASVDQIIGMAAKGTCPLPTLELAMHTPRRGISPSGLPWAYGNCVSWRNATTPVPQEVSPMRAFLRLFEDAGLSSSPSRKVKKSFEPGKSVVDAVLEDAKQLQRRLGRNDTQKLDEYLTAVRDVELRVTRQQGQQKGVKITEEILQDIKATGSRIKKHSNSDKLSALPKIQYDEYIKSMMDIMALSFWSNSTRACTLMLGDGASRRNLSFLDGVAGDHHSISHHGNNPDKLKQYAIINNFFVEQYTYLLQRLQSMEEGSSNVLENSMVMMGSGMGNGQNHLKSGIPVVIAGSGGGKVKTNRHIKAGGRTHISSLHRSVLDVMNISDEEIKGKGGGLSGF